MEIKGKGIHTKGKKVLGLIHTVKYTNKLTKTERYICAGVT